MNEIRTIQNSKTLVLFITLSILVLLFIKQDEVVERNSIAYWLILLPALFLPLTKLQEVTYNIIFKTWPLLLMFFIALIWSLFSNDTHILFRLSLFLIVLSWLEINSLTIKVKTLSSIYIMAILIAIFVYMFSDINHWGDYPRGYR